MRTRRHHNLPASHGRQNSSSTTLIYRAMQSTGRGKLVRQGEVIGYVGDTGNAGAGNFHLHFSIAVAADPTRYWEGININPYPLLHK